MRHPRPSQHIGSDQKRVGPAAVGAIEGLIEMLGYAPGLCERERARVVVVGTLTTRIVMPPPRHR
jgi:hypothetical protein